MGTRTETETEAGAGPGTGSENERDDAVVDATDADATQPEPEPEREREPQPDREEDADGAGAGESSGVGQGAAAVVSGAFGLVSLTGSWLGTVAAARETLVGQLETAADADVATQVKEVYGDAWNTSALWGGLFALTALIVGVVVLAGPAFGRPGRTAPAPWIKSVAWAGVTLGVVGLLLAVLTYTGVLLGLPTTG